MLEKRPSFIKEMTQAGSRKVPPTPYLSAFAHFTVQHASKHSMELVSRLLFIVQKHIYGQDTFHVHL